MGLGGVLILNLLFLAVGYALLAGPLRASSLSTWATYAGVALLVGAAAVGVVLGTLVIFGPRIGITALLVTSAALIAAGVAAAYLVDARVERQPPPAPPRSGLEDAVAVAAAYGAAAILLVAFVGSFRASAWLDDTWFFWLPKGIALDTLGLDARLFAPNDEYVFFERTDNPYWWSIVLQLDMRFVGDVDLRAAPVQLTLLVAAFVASIGVQPGVVVAVVDPTAGRTNENQAQKRGKVSRHGREYWPAGQEGATRSRHGGPAACAPCRAEVPGLHGITWTSGLHVVPETVHTPPDEVERRQQSCGGRVAESSLEPSTEQSRVKVPARSRSSRALLPRPTTCARLRTC